MKDKRSKTNRKGVALLVVLFIIMAITILSLGFLSRSDVELACGENMILRTQMDYLSESGLEHARGLILNDNDFTGDWTAPRQQLYNGNDYYDVNVVYPGGCNYKITCDAYREKGGERIGRSSLEAELRLDPCIAFWTQTGTTISNNVVINGDVYCNGTLTNNGRVKGDVFAVSLSGSGTKSGQLYDTNKAASVTCPNLEIGDFTPTYIPDANGNVELSGDTVINGTLVVDGNVIISGGSMVNVIASKNSPALLIDGKVEIKDSSKLTIEGFAQITAGISIESGAKFEISGSLFIVGIGGISDSGQVIITADPVKASFLLPPTPDSNQERWSPVGGAFFRSIKRK